MSVFKVALNNTAQGLLDVHPTTGVQMDPSSQRQVYVMGPNKINRLLSDGETFTDCNYWKRFAFPQCSYEQAIVETLTDDGSIYSDIPGENTYPLVYTFDGAIDLTYANNQADILGDTGGYAIFAQITNNDSSEPVTVRLNGSTDAVFTLSASETQVFNAGDLAISMIEVANLVSGGTTIDCELIVSVKSVCST